MVSSFSGEYRFLSNFFICPVEYKGLLFTSSEAAYQSAKCAHDYLRPIFVNMFPGKAKRLGRDVPLRADWEQVKVLVMREILSIKFSGQPLKSLLLDTGSQELVEGNNWGDVFWGVCNGVGENNLGKLLMELRFKLRSES